MKPVYKYVALLRGISPLNLNMRNEKLRTVFEELGFTNVTTVISSGNVIFTSPQRNIQTLEDRIEKALPKKLGFTSTTIIRSQLQLQDLLAAQPFGDLRHEPSTYLTVTFLKHTTPAATAITARGARVLRVHKNSAVCAVVDTTSAKTPNFMAMLEKHYGKQITTRTWGTLQKISKKMASI